MLENSVEGYVVFQAEADGWWSRKVKWIGRTGAPDRVFAKGGRTVWIEFKRPKKEAAEMQAREHKRMRDAGMEVHVCDTIPKAMMVLGLQ